MEPASAACQPCGAGGRAEGAGAGGANGGPPLWVFAVLRHAGWRERAHVSALCREWRAGLSADGRSIYWRVLCEALADSTGVYIDTKREDAVDWREAFRGMWRMRTRFAGRAKGVREREGWGEREDVDGHGCMGAEEDADGSGGEPAAESTTFSIRVCARFRPLRAPAAGAAGTAGARRVILPLHQRLAMIRARGVVEGDKAVSQSDALRTLWAEVGRRNDSEAGPWRDQRAVPEEAPRAGSHDGREGQGGAPEEAADAEQPEQGAASDFAASVVSVDEESGAVLTVAPPLGLREWKFDAALPSGAGQARVYAATAKAIVADFINGRDGCVFAYGQTGSGKTHSMVGPDGALRSEREADNRGIIPRALEEAVAAVEWRRRWLAERGAVSDAIGLTLSYVEVFGDEVTDLLKAGRRVGQNKVAAQRYVLEGAAAQRVSSLEDALRLVMLGLSQRRVAATRMNERSSRAHALLTLTLEQPDAASESAPPLVSRLILADLGGSEKVDKSGANAGLVAPGAANWHEYYASRERLVEAANINSGLFALKRVIAALNDRQRLSAEGDARAAARVHVPHQDSRLTLILSSALTGGARCSVCVTCASEAEHVSETLQTLRFGESTRQVAHTSIDLSDVARSALRAALATLDAGIARCEEEIRVRERWETKEVRRVDKMTQEVELLRVTAPVGAEESRERLEALLVKRRTLLGHGSGAQPEGGAGG